MKRVVITVGLALAGAFAIVPVANASPNPETFDANPAWFCQSEGAPLPPNHCLNTKSSGDTLNLKVLEPDPRGPQESASFNPKADARPCPHDPDADPDGTWWEAAPGLYVCHHRP